MSKKESKTLRIKLHLNVLKQNVINLNYKIKLFILLTIVLVVVSLGYIFFKPTKSSITYQTSTVEKGTLISSISGSGTITSGNYTNVSTKVSGVVSKVYVDNGDYVKKGQKIAEVALDDYAKERQAAAWVAYLEAKENYLSAISAKSEADIAMWQARQEVMNAQEDLDDMNDGGDNPDTGEAYTDTERMVINKTLPQKREAFSAVEAKYLNADADIANSSAKVAAALRDYQENSSTIVAPASGTITDLALAEGIIVSASSTTSQTSGATIVSAQIVGKVNDTGGQLIATVSLSEVDIISVAANQKVTLTLDAYEDKTFTGRVMAVNTSGSVSSGVTSYPVTILLDPVETAIYPNMAVSVNIITQIKPDVLLIPSTAINHQNSSNTIEIIKNGQVSSIEIELGDSNDSQTEIISGIEEGQEIVTSKVIANDSSDEDDTSSPFSGSNSGGMMSGPPGGF